MSSESRRLLLWIGLAIVALWLLQRFQLRAALGIGAGGGSLAGNGGGGNGRGAPAAGACCGGCNDRRTSAELSTAYNADPGDYSAGGFLDGSPIEISEAPWFGSPAPIAGPYGNYSQGG